MQASIDSIPLGMSLRQADSLEGRENWNDSGAKSVEILHGKPFGICARKYETDLTLIGLGCWSCAADPALTRRSLFGLQPSNLILSFCQL